MHLCDIMIKLVLLRHGQSAWNLENRFTGWTDVDLSPQGVKEAKSAGKIMKEEGYVFDAVHTSVLKRAVRTTWLVMDEMELMWLPVYNSWRLNERHYGALQGLNKAETAQKYGEVQVKIWRRSYDVQPPALDKKDERFPGFDPRYQELTAEELPLTESLKDTVARVMPYWNEAIVPELKKGKKLLISAHGNSMRALVKYMDKMSDEAVVELNIPTGIPLVYELDDKLHPVRHYYLGNPEEIRKAAESVAKQGKAKVALSANRKPPITAEREAKVEKKVKK